jgi:hypothetical protein
VFTNALTYNREQKGGVFDCAEALLKSFEADLKVALKRLSDPTANLKPRGLAMLNELCELTIDGEQPSRLFLAPVDEKVYKTYRAFVERPMDFRQIRVSILDWLCCAW